MFVYNLAIQLYVFAIRLASLIGNQKAHQWLVGRKNWREKLKTQLKDGEERVWFHCSSLGEFEQGRMLLEKLQISKIVLTFFSPSGYEIRKNYEHADYVFYLPIDTRKNAVDFINLVKPTKVFFVKYDFWFHYLRELHYKEVPVYFISSAFRSNHRFFKWYGSFFKKTLGYVTHFFVQNDESKELLHSIGFDNATVCGDTRFDRVVEIASKHKEIQSVRQFSSSHKLIMVAGSTWPQDEELLIQLIKNSSLNFGEMGFIVVPHEIIHHHIGALEYSLIEKAGLKPDDIAIYSHDKNNLSAARVFIIDTIGLLSSLYHYGDFAYIGGGFGKGIHNVLEAAVYGIPVFFGPNYQKFPEAIELIKAGAAFSVNSSGELAGNLKRFIENKEEKEKADVAAKNYVMMNAGATERILKHLE